MHWQEAAAKSPIGQAQRVSGDQTFYRYADGAAFYARQGWRHEAEPQKVEGYDDWVPVVPRGAEAQRGQLTPEAWTRINQVMELVKQEGDASCEAAFDDLLRVQRELREEFEDLLQAAEQAHRLNRITAGLCAQIVAARQVLRGDSG